VSIDVGNERIHVGAVCTAIVAGVKVQYAIVAVVKVWPLGEQRPAAP
jgi:hypothetical protein